LKKTIHDFFQRRLRNAWFSLRSRNQAHKNVPDFTGPSVARSSRRLKESFNSLLSSGGWNFSRAFSANALTNFTALGATGRHPKDARYCACSG
jgi:hypothetical protein